MCIYIHKMYELHECISRLRVPLLRCREGCEWSSFLLASPATLAPDIGDGKQALLLANMVPIYWIYSQAYGISIERCPKFGDRCEFNL